MVNGVISRSMLFYETCAVSQQSHKVCRVLLTFSSLHLVLNFYASLHLLFLREAIIFSARITIPYFYHKALPSNEVTHHKKHAILDHRLLLGMELYQISGHEWLSRRFHYRRQCFPCLRQIQYDLQCKIGVCFFCFQLLQLFCSN